MNVEKNRQTVLAFMAAMTEGRRDPELLTEDVRWWVPGRGLLDPETFGAIAGAFRELLATPFAMTITHVTAEGDRVAVESNGYATLKDGRRYANDYHFLFLLRDGRIREVREHNNSLIPHLLFGDKLPPMPNLPESAPVQAPA